jgi:hypothetical protein
MEMEVEAQAGAEAEVEVEAVLRHAHNIAQMRQNG